MLTKKRETAESATLTGKSGGSYCEMPVAPNAHGISMTQERSLSFNDPPVVETALTVQFDELLDFRAYHFGLFYPAVSGDFPVVEDKPRLPPIRETFPLRPSAQTLRLDPSTGRPQRVWYREQGDGGRLLQLQPDRLSLNWTGQRGGMYPRYSANKPVLLEQLERLGRFAEELGLGSLRPNLCEVTYVNHIRPAAGESIGDCFQNTFTGISWQTSTDFLPGLPRAASVNQVYDIPGDAGRLYAETAVALDPRGDYIVMKLTGRVIHRDGVEVETSLDTAHRWAVKGFESLTTNDARTNRWEQMQ